MPKLSAKKFREDSETRQSLMLVTERLVVERGFAQVTVRDITSAVGTNVSAVNYHFGSKDALLFEIFRKRAHELHVERVAALNDITKNKEQPPSLRDILAALLTPALRYVAPNSDRKNAALFVARARLEGPEEIKSIINSNFKTLEQFAQALSKCRPELSLEDIYWRMFYVLAIQHDLMTSMERLVKMSDNRCNFSDMDKVIERTLDYVEKGF